MISTDPDPRKKRKLTLNNKTPTRLRGPFRSGLRQCTPKSANIPLSKKSRRNLGEKVDSSDDSSLEIGWDNNSPNPSECAKPGRRRENTKSNDISAILKKVPRKKTVDAKEQHSHGALTTWMQDNLAVCTISIDRCTKNSSRKSRNRSLQRKGAKSFNEELKSFVEKVIHSGEANGIPVGSDDQRKSHRITDDKKDSPPLNPLRESPITAPLVPVMFDGINLTGIDDHPSNDETTPCKIYMEEDGQTDNSLMDIDFDDELDEILSSQPIELQAVNNELSKKNVEDVDLKTAKKNCESDARMSTDKCHLKDDVISLIEEKYTDASFLLDDTFPDILIEFDTITNNINKTSSPAVIKNDKVVKSPLDAYNKLNKSPLNGSNKVEKSRECTPNNKKSPIDLIGFDDADELFEDIIMTLDDNFKCKSQETPPRITSDQRNMKLRCHTSPFPLNSKRTLISSEHLANGKNIKDASPNLVDKGGKCILNKFSDTDNRNKSILAVKDFKDVTLKIPPDKTGVLPVNKTDQKQFRNEPNTYKNDGKLVVNQKQIATSNKNEPCNFNPSSKKTNGYTFKKTCTGIVPKIKKNNDISTKKYPLDLSVIGEKENTMEDDVSLCLPTSDGNVEPMLFTSTQKCSMDEIQRKRQEAQMKLKQRMTWKK